jgi:hypothetical protein
LSIPGIFNSCVGGSKLKEQAGIDIIIMLMLRDQIARIVEPLSVIIMSGHQVPNAFLEKPHVMECVVVLFLGWLSPKAWKRGNDLARGDKQEGM